MLAIEVIQSSSDALTTFRSLPPVPPDPRTSANAVITDDCRHRDAGCCRCLCSSGRRSHGRAGPAQEQPRERIVDRGEHKLWRRVCYVRVPARTRNKPAGSSGSAVPGPATEVQGCGRSENCLASRASSSRVMRRSKFRHGVVDWLCTEKHTTTDRLRLTSAGYGPERRELHCRSRTTATGGVLTIDPLIPSANQQSKPSR